MNAPVKLKGDDWRDYRHPVTRAKLPGKSEIVENIGWNRDGLMAYAHHCAKNGANHWADRQFKADTGTLTHTFIEQTLRGEEVRGPSGISPRMMALALVGLAAFNAWRAKHTVEVVALEVALVDGEMGFGCTLDAALRVDGVLVIADWKTGSAHDEMIIGMAAYWHMWNRHNAEKVHEAMVLRCPTDGSAAVEYRIGTDLLAKGAVAFTAALTLERIRSSIKLPTPVAVEEGV